MDEKLLNDHVGEKFYLGFGFSPIVNDYRIVRVRLCPFFYYVVYGAEVFSGSTGSWKKLEVENLKGVTLMERDGFSTDGAIYWFGSKSKPRVAEKGENDSDLIVLF
ncbi:hypothetical protein K1719_028792 [Acacia pycnantha]|nr:hypothetical protein K1719_028792 [Acacia pycnantha]